MTIITSSISLISGGASGTVFLSPITLNTATKTITIAPGSGILPLSGDGVTGQALYSALKILWKNNTSYIKLPFPMVAITPEQFEIYNGWSFADNTTRKALRTCGWAERNSSGNVTAMYAGIISLGSLGSTDQAYYQQVGSTTAATSFTFPGPINEAIQIISDPTGTGSYSGGFDNRAYLKLFARVQGKTYSSAALSDIGVISLTYICNRFPLANSADLKIADTDAIVVSNTATYGGITINYYSTPQSRTIGGTSYNFNTIISGNSQTAEAIYTKVQYLLRQTTNINSGTGTQLGNISNALLSFVGNNLSTANGVYIDAFNSNDTNRITFTDNTGTGRTFPFVAAGNILFNTNLVNDSSAVYEMFFTTNPAGNFGTSSAVVVQDASGTNIAGNVGGLATIPFSFNYDSNVQGGRTASVDASVTVVAIGLTTGQYVSQTATITRATGQNISLVSALERVYN